MTAEISRRNLSVTTLVENTVSISGRGLLGEHGLALWLEYGDKRILFDTGASGMVVKNAEKLGVDLAAADAIVLSHGHCDHTGGLRAALEIAAKAKIYLHPAALEAKFSMKSSGPEAIGMPDSARYALQNRELVWTTAPRAICPGLTVTGPVPRLNEFEDVGGAFFLDEQGRNPDTLPDDQTLFIETPQGLVLICGCAHAGVVNIMSYIAALTGTRQFHAIMGGLHLLHAAGERIARTAAALREFHLRKIGPAHCTGAEVTRNLWQEFPDQCFSGAVGAGPWLT
jgi:7,8-dihydropterin-6-yl-methyl-4-(beta-D-ribofuranosyl)aminobenzene 5'-phosphate synthase